MTQITRPDGYTVCSKGNVYSPRGNLLKVHLDRDGYCRIRIKLVTCGVHRIVAEAFLPSPENKPTVNHKDGIKAHNWVDNLEWATYSENNKHAYSTGLNTAVRGAARSDSRLTAQDVADLRESYPDRYIGWAKEMCAKYGVTKATIYNAVSGRHYA